MSKAKRLREALRTAAPGITGEELAEKASLSEKSLKSTLYPFMQREEVLVTSGKGDAPDRFYLNVDYEKRKGGGGRKKKAKVEKRKAKKPRKLKRAPAAASAPKAASPETFAAALVLRHVATTFAVLEAVMAPIEGPELAAFQAHREAVELLTAR